MWFWYFSLSIWQLANNVEQLSHGNCSPQWTSICLCSQYGILKTKWHTGHLVSSLPTAGTAYGTSWTSLASGWGAGRSSSLTRAAICFCMVNNAAFFTTTSSGPGAHPVAAAADLAATEGTPDIPGTGVGAGTLCLTAQWAMDGSKSRSSASSSLEIPTNAPSSVSPGHFLLKTSTQLWAF